MCYLGELLAPYASCHLNGANKIGLLKTLQPQPPLKPLSSLFSSPWPPPLPIWLLFSPSDVLCPLLPQALCTNCPSVSSLWLFIAAHMLTSLGQPPWQQADLGSLFRTLVEPHACSSQHS